MKGSEYIAARLAITFAGLIAGGLAVTATALWLVPLIMRGLGAIAPNLLPPIGGVLLGLAVVVLVAVLMKGVLRLILTRFEDYTMQNGGIEDL
jgi:hypothetical protein